MLDDSFTAALRAKLHSAQLDSGQSLSDLAAALGIESESALKETFAKGDAISVGLLHRYAGLVGKPIWWFFGEQPSSMTIESAETAVANVARMRLYLDAIETEFQHVLGGSRARSTPKRTVPEFEQGAVVVDFAPYLSRARAILEREAECTEDSEEVFEESVEMIAHSLYSIEMAIAPSRESH